MQKLKPVVHAKENHTHIIFGYGFYSPFPQPVLWLSFRIMD